MIKPPSVQSEYSLVYSGDPALNLPDDEKERERVLNVARDTGDWSPLIITGQVPTVFHCRRLPGTLLNWIIGEKEHSHEFGRPLTQVEVFVLMFRAALRRIEGWGEHNRVGAEKIGEGRWTIADEGVPNLLYSIDPNDRKVGVAILDELGGAVFAKEMNLLRPL